MTDKNRNSIYFRVLIWWWILFGHKHYCVFRNVFNQKWKWLL